MKTILKTLTGLSLAISAILLLGGTTASAQILTVKDAGFTEGLNGSGTIDWTEGPGSIVFNQRNGQYTTFSNSSLDPSGDFGSVTTGTVSQDLGSQISGLNLGTFTFSSSIASNGNNHSVVTGDSITLQLFDNTTSTAIGSTVITASQVSGSALTTLA